MRHICHYALKYILESFVKKFKDDINVQKDIKILVNPSSKQNHSNENINKIRNNTEEGAVVLRKLASTCFTLNTYYRALKSVSVTTLNAGIRSRTL